MKKWKCASIFEIKIQQQKRHLSDMTQKRHLSDMTQISQCRSIMMDRKLKKLNKIYTNIKS